MKQEKSENPTKNTPNRVIYDDFWQGTCNIVKHCYTFVHHFFTKTFKS